MAREINWDEELSDEDRAWAEQRRDMSSGRDGMTIGEQIDRNDEKFGAEAKKANMSREEQMAELRTTIADSQNELARLEAEQAAEENANKRLAGTLGDQERGLIVVDNTPVDGEKPEGSEDAVEDYSDTKKWTVDALKAEIKRRNDDGADLAVSGTRSELVERLMADDRELAQG